MTVTRIEHEHGRRWFWSGERITFVTINGAWRRFTWMARKFDPARLPS